MRKRPEYLGYIASAYLCIGILTAALGSEAPLMTPGIFLFRRFHLAAFYFPFMISLGALLVHTGRTPRMIMRLIWLSPVPFLTAALTFQTAAARMEFAAVSALTDAFGRIPATLLLILLFALETVGFVKLAALGLPRDETLFDLSAVKRRLNAFLYELGLADMHSEAHDEENASDLPAAQGAGEASPAGESAFPGAGAALAGAGEAEAAAEAGPGVESVFSGEAEVAETGEAAADLREFPPAAMAMADLREFSESSDSVGAVEAPGFDGAGSAGAVEVSGFGEAGSAGADIPGIPGILDIPNIPIEELLSEGVLSDPAFAHLVKHESEGGRPGSSGAAGAAFPGAGAAGPRDIGSEEALPEGAFPGAEEGPPGAVEAASFAVDEGASKRFRDAPSLVSGAAFPDPAPPSEVILADPPLEAEWEEAAPAGPSEVTLADPPLEVESEEAVPAGPSEVNLSETSFEVEAEAAVPALPSEVTLSEPSLEAESEEAVPAGPSEVTLAEPPLEAEWEEVVPAGPSEVTVSENSSEMEAESSAAGPSEVNFLEGWTEDEAEEDEEGAAISRKLDPQGTEPRGIVGEKPAPPRPRGRPRYEVPSAGVLADYPDSDFSSIDDATRRGGAILEQTLKEFKIDARVTGIRKGPVITMYELLPSPGVKISSIVNLQDNIALRLAASRVRMVAPIPGKHAIGIEVPNKKRAIVSFSSMVESDEFREADSGIPVILGKDISGGNQVIDLTRTPHLLIAGATGSGKSVCVNSLIGSILYSRAPVDVKMIMVDPKIVELKLYNDIPHLLTPVITEPKRALQALQWCLCEMERRYSLLDSQGVRDMSSYNRRVRDRRLATERLPSIVVVVDEFADLMATSGKELEGIVARLAAMSRAVGIHLVLATQRPSVDVITGLIKANFPSRIAFMVAGKTDSRIIIDAMGAEKLLGRGDMLFTSAWDPFPSRMQGAFLAEEEVERMAEHVKGLGEPEYIDDEMFFDEEDDDEFELEAPSGDDPMYEKALEIVVSTRKASASYLQRRLKIGYNRAARLVEEMERRGIVGPANGSKPRDLIHIPDRFSSPPGGIASGAAEQESAPA